MTNYPPKVQALIDQVVEVAIREGITDEAGVSALTHAAMPFLTKEDFQAVALAECERLVREFLDRDVAAGLVMYDPETDTYRRASA